MTKTKFVSISVPISAVPHTRQPRPSNQGSVSLILFICEAFVALGEKVTKIYHESVYRDLTDKVKKAVELNVDRFALKITRYVPEDQEENALKSGVKILAHLIDEIKKNLDTIDKQGLNETQSLPVNQISDAIDRFIEANPLYTEDDFINGEVSAFKAWKDEPSSTQSDAGN